MNVVSLNKDRNLVANFAKDVINSGYRKTFLESVNMIDLEFEDAGKSVVLKGVYQGKVKVEL